MPSFGLEGAAAGCEQQPHVFPDSPLAQLQRSFSTKASMVEPAASPFTELAALPYVMVQATPQGMGAKAAAGSKAAGGFGFFAGGRRAVSAQPLSMDFSMAVDDDCYDAAGSHRTQRSCTAAALDVDQLIAGFVGKPAPYDSGDVVTIAAAAAAAGDLSVMLEPLVEEEGASSSSCAASEAGADHGSSQDQDAVVVPTAVALGSGLAPAVRGVLEQYAAVPIASGCDAGIASAAQMFIWESRLGDTFYTYDLGEVARLYHTWCATMPRVTPFYAVKCNPEPGVIAMLNALGAGFDCASIQELERAAALSVPQSRVIFANPCKRPADFRYAAEKGVEYTTFDCASELEKIAAWYPSFKCVLRIRCDDSEAKINLGLKYGADMADVPYLLSLARSLGLQVVGVSFHVGSGCQNVGVYAEAIESARAAFDAAAALGYNMELLDIGGGFTAPYDAATAELFHRTAQVINAAIDAHFPPDCGVRIIAEPGRYFAETSATLFTTILGQRSLADGEGQEFRDYWLSDSTYGSFRILVAVDGLEPNYSVLRSPLLPEPSAEEAARTPCRLWGNDDGEGDCVHKLTRLPRLRNGDWLMFPYAGAYTICAASNYGGVRMTEPLKLYVYSEVAPRDLGAWQGLLPAPTACGGAAVDIAGPAAAGAAGAAASGTEDDCGGDCGGSPLQVLLRAAAAAGDCEEAGSGGSVVMECCELEGSGCCCSALSNESDDTAVGAGEEAMEVSSAMVGN